MVRVVRSTSRARVRELGICGEPDVEADDLEPGLRSDRVAADLEGIKLETGPRYFGRVTFEKRERRLRLAQT